MDKMLRGALLLDFYGVLLTDRQRSFFELYYLNDLSLSEIAEQNGITPQGVSDTIKRAEHAMEGYEQKLGLIEKHFLRSTAVDAIIANIDSAASGTEITVNCKAFLTELRKTLQTLIFN